MAERSEAVQFATKQQRLQATTLGMWVFLATEALFLGAVIAGYVIYRVHYGKTFGEASHHLDQLLGTLNTGILLSSSLTMALADRAVEGRRRRATFWLLVLTAVLGSVFLGIKFYEYSKEISHHLAPLPWFEFHYPGSNTGQAQLFFNFYFTLTGLHAAHLATGIGIVSVIAVQTWRWRDSDSLLRRVTVTGLYWHFVDIVWVFLYPLLYLV